MYEKMFTLKKTFDPFKNFQHIARIVEVPLVFAISSAIPAKTLPEFIDYAKRKGDFSAGSWGVGSGGHLQTAELASQAQLKFVHAVYKGEGPILLDVMAGLVDGGFFSVSAAMAQAATGKLTLLAVTGAQRHPLAPDVPTFAERGFKGFDSSLWQGRAGRHREPGGQPHRRRHGPEGHRFQGRKNGHHARAAGGRALAEIPGEKLREPRSGDAQIQHRAAMSRTMSDRFGIELGDVPDYYAALHPQRMAVVYPDGESISWGRRRISCRTSCRRMKSPPSARWPRRAW
jgi:hypothetical protein